MDLYVAMSTFAEVVQSGSMNAAARRLNVTGALVGQRIAALEDRLQTRLLNRSTRHQSLTTFGESYFKQCLDILELVSMSDGLASEQQVHPQGKLRITAPMSFGSEALMPALPRFRALAPDVEVEVILSDQNLELIPESVDVAFRIGPLDDSTLIKRRLAPYQMMICAAPSYLAEFGIPQHPHDLDGHKAVLFSRTAGKPWRLQKGPEKHVWSPDVAVTVNAGQAVRMATRAGIGIAMLPKVLVEKDVSSGELVQLLPEWTLPEQPMSLLYHRDRHMPSRLVFFLDFASGEFG
ncbi:LysR family transcriptional regulator [Roseibium algae]|uniref:LysR family transcriptional regulator n=1 Tax=Roseibium algae TaxID=3123038 RepID=A0ABU8TJ77_9HYPH